MSSKSRSPRILPGLERTGEALPLWTYASAELLELEYREFFLKSWQMVGHECDLPKAGDFLTFDLWRDSGIPTPKNFPDIDRSELGLQEVRMEIYRGHILVNLDGDGPAVSHMMGPIDGEVAAYSPEGYEPIGEPTVQVWDCNWKLAWDNYQENYHIPIGHPCLHRMLVENDEGVTLDNGINFGVFEMKEKLSKVPRERRYQELIGCTDRRFSPDKARRWLQIAMNPNMGIEYYPEMFALFQVLPLGPEKSLIKLNCYSPPDLSDEEREMQGINLAILDEVNDQDKLLVERIQRGVRTSGYRPGPLALEESSVYRFHEYVRETIPVARLREPPIRGMLERENARLQASAASEAQ